MSVRKHDMMVQNMEARIKKAKNLNEILTNSADHFQHHEIQFKLSVLNQQVDFLKQFSQL